MNTKNKPIEQLDGSFAKVINSHGHAFQYSVIRAADKLLSEEKSSWVFEAAEVPVEVQGAGTRIDFILRRRSGLRQYLLAECKRVNPALANWCFAKAPYVHRGRREQEAIYIERVQREVRNTKSYGIQVGVAQNVCHLAVEIRSNETGDPSGRGKGAIEEAATQISRGLNGFVELLSQHSGMMNVHPILVSPVIFTTAKLWLSDVDLSSAELMTGNLDFSNNSLKETPWVSYQYHLSPGLKHSFWMGNSPSEISNVMDLDYIRTIHIVSAAGIEDFLQWSSDAEIFS